MTAKEISEALKAQHGIEVPKNKIVLDEQIKASETALAGMIDELTGSEFDMKGLSEFQSLLKGE